MTASIPKPANDPDTVPRPVVGLTIELAIVGDTEAHRHRKAQLLYVISGVITVEVSGGVWTVPPHCAIWIPPDTLHRARATGHIAVGSLYLEPDLVAPFRDECGIIFVQPLLRELILRAVGGLSLYPEGDTRETRLVAVLLDELRAAPMELLYLPMPQDRRIKRLAEALIGEPALRLTIEEWGERVGVSKRTLSRLFQRETGMSFLRWKHQLHVGLALQRLAGGEQVTSISLELGYESPSAFIAMFRRMLGRPPARYFGTAVTGSLSDAAE